MLRLIISSIWYQSVSPATQIPCNRQMMRSSIPFSPFSSPHVLAPSPMPYYPPYEWWTWQGEREQEQTTSHPHVSGTRMNGFRDGYSRAPTSPSLPPSKTTPASALCENSSLPLPHIHSAYCIVLEEAFTVHGPPHQISLHLWNKQLKERRPSRNRKENKQSRTGWEEHLLHTATLMWSGNTLNDSIRFQINYSNLTTFTSSKTLWDGR